jgi:Flp pilus assembly protein TadB
MARRSVIRASDSERDAVAERLRRAAAEGRILASELEHRLGIALRARTIGELDVLVRDLPRGRAPRSRPVGVAVGQVAVLALVAVVAVAVIGAVIALVTGLAVVWAICALVWMMLRPRGRRRRPPRGPRFRGGVHLHASRPLR